MTLATLAAATAPGQSEGTQRWAFSTLSTATAGNIVSSPAVAPDGTVYVGVEVGSATSSNPSGRLFAISPTGAQKWVYTTPEWVDSTPAIAPDGTIYFGCWDGKLYALRPDGTLKWSFSAGSYISGSPALGADGTIYVGTGNGNLQAVTPEGTLKWTFPTTDWIESSPAIAPDGTIYFGSWNNTFYAVAPNGVEKWHYDTGGDVVSSPAIAADGTVYVGSRDFLLYAFTPEGDLKWRVGDGDTIEASPSIAADGTIYIATTGGRIYAYAPDGTERWRYPAMSQPALDAIYSSAAIRTDGTIVFGSSNNGLYALNADGTLRWRAALGDWADSSPVIAADGTIYIGCTDKRLYSIQGNGQPADPGAPWAQYRQAGLRHGRAPRIVAAVTPAASVHAVNESATFVLAATVEGPAPAYQWLHNGAEANPAASATLAVDGLQLHHAGMYHARLASTATQLFTAPATLGFAITTKVAGSGEEIGPDILHPNKNTYDQVLLQGPAAAITADAGQVTRISFVDIDDDIVQVEFAGRGTVTVILDAPSGPAPPAKYNQPGVEYMKGHPAIVVSNADETTHLSVFSVGRATAFNQSLFYDDVTYDGLATVAYIAIHSANGNFGGVRTANTHYLGTRGHVGLYAPNVRFFGPVYVGDITAAEAAVPVLILGAAESATQINGGDLLQLNHRPVQIGGLTQLHFVDGTTSHGGFLARQTIKGQLQQDGAIVTNTIATTPAP